MAQITQVSAPSATSYSLQSSTIARTSSPVGGRKLGGAQAGHILRRCTDCSTRFDCLLQLSRSRFIPQTRKAAWVPGGRYRVDNIVQQSSQSLASAASIDSKGQDVNLKTSPVEQLSAVPPVTKRALLAGMATLLLCTTGTEDASAIEKEKRKNLSIEELKDIIERDMRVGKYFVTGDLTREVYNENCRFKDPTNDTTGVDKYLQAVALLFDPKLSTLDLKSIKVTSPRTVETTWDLQGYLKFPWKPKVGTSGTTTYTVDDDGLIILHDETWAVSPFKALLDSFTPSRGPTS